jgi:hypothetical protein
VKGIVTFSLTRGHVRDLTIVMTFFALVTGSLISQTPVPKPAVPLEPLSAILNAFKTHEIVALGEGYHGNEQGHAFRQSLIRDPRFATIVNDIIVEFGNALYQGVMDRFVRGGDVSDDTLRRVWEDTTQANSVWDSYIYEEFFRTVREVNSSLPREKQLRVLLGDPPMNWDEVRTTDDLRTRDTLLYQRDSYPVEVIEREVLRKGRRALVIYGEGHVGRSAKGSVISLLERDGGTKAFTITTNTAVDLSEIQPDVARWPAPSLALLPGTVLGTTGLAAYWQVDALLYLGPPSVITFARIPARRCADKKYMEKRLARMASVRTPPNSLEEFKRNCAGGQ